MDLSISELDMKKYLDKKENLFPTDPESGYEEAACDFSDNHSKNSKEAACDLSDSHSKDSQHRIMTLSLDSLMEDKITETSSLTDLGSIIVDMPEDDETDDLRESFEETLSGDISMISLDPVISPFVGIRNRSLLSSGDSISKSPAPSFVSSMSPLPSSDLSMSPSPSYKSSMSPSPSSKSSMSPSPSSKSSMSPSPSSKSSAPSPSSKYSMSPSPSSKSSMSPAPSSKSSAPSPDPSLMRGRTTMLSGPERHQTIPRPGRWSRDSRIPVRNTPENKNTKNNKNFTDTNDNKNTRNNKNFTDTKDNTNSKDVNDNQILKDNMDIKYVEDIKDTKNVQETEFIKNCHETKPNRDSISYGDNKYIRMERDKKISEKKNLDGKRTKGMHPNLQKSIVRRCWNQNTRETSSLWDLQKTLGKGDFIDGVLRLSLDRGREVSIFTPVFLEPNDGQLVGWSKTAPPLLLQPTSSVLQHLYDQRRNKENQICP